MTLSITIKNETLSITTLHANFCYTVSQFYLYTEFCYAQCRIFNSMLSVVMLSVTVMNVVALFWIPESYKNSPRNFRSVLLKRTSKLCSKSKILRSLSEAKLILPNFLLANAFTVKHEQPSLIFAGKGQAYLCGTPHLALC
jgi:hypothetical protein